MPNRPNPYFGGFKNQTIADLFQSMAAMRQQAQPQQASPYDAARAEQALSAAALNRAKTTGQANKNDAMATAPSRLAELFLSGGKVQDDPVSMNPNWRDTLDAPRTLPSDFFATGQDFPMTGPVTEAGPSAQQKIAEAVQEALIRGVPLAEIAKFAGQGGYLNSVNSGDAEAGRGYLPLFGKMPTDSTALTTERADQMRSGDAMDRFVRDVTLQDMRGTQGLALEEVRGRNQRDLEGIKGGNRVELEGVKGDNRLSLESVRAANRRVTEEARAAERQRLRDAGFVVDANGRVRVSSERAERTPTPLTVSTAEADRIGQKVVDFAKEKKLTLDSDARQALVAQIARRMQSGRNMPDAFISVMDDLGNGDLAGLTTEVRSRWYSDQTIVRRTPNEPGAPPAEAIEFLKQNPNLAADFDRKYGQGASRLYLK